MDRWAQEDFAVEREAAAEARRKLAVGAAPPGPPPAPHDFAAERRAAMEARNQSTAERAVSFHGKSADGSTTTTYTDGCKRVVKANGAVVELYPDGTKRTVLRDGSEIVKHSDGSKYQRTPDGVELVVGPAGRRRTQMMADPHTGRPVHIETLPSGSTIQTTSDEDSRTTSVRVDRDGEKTTRTPDGVVISNHPDGSLHQRFPDGTVIYVDANGVMTQINPDGSVTWKGSDAVVHKAATMDECARQLGHTLPPLPQPVQMDVAPIQRPPPPPPLEQYVEPPEGQAKPPARRKAATRSAPPPGTLPVGKRKPASASKPKPTPKPRKAALRAGKRRAQKVAPARKGSLVPPGARKQAAARKEAARKSAAKKRAAKAQVEEEAAAADKAQRRAAKSAARNAANKRARAKEARRAEREHSTESQLQADLSIREAMAEREAEEQDAMRARQRRDIDAQEAALRRAVRERAPRERAQLASGGTAAQAVKKRLDDLVVQHEQERRTMQMRHTELHDELQDTAAALEELKKSSRLREVKTKIRELGMRQLVRKSREAPAGALSAIREETARDMAGELVRAVADAKEEERRKLDQTRAEYKREREVLAGVVSFKDSLIASAVEETAALKRRTDSNRKSMNSQLAEANAAGKALARQVQEAMQEELELQRQLSEAAIAKERTAAVKMKVGSMFTRAAHKSRAKAASYDRDVAIARQQELAEELSRAHRAVRFLRSEIVRADVKRGWDSAESRAALDAEFERRLKGYGDDAAEEEESALVAPAVKPNLGWQAPGAAAHGGTDTGERGALGTASDSANGAALRRGLDMAIMHACDALDAELIESLLFTARARAHTSAATEFASVIFEELRGAAASEPLFAAAKTSMRAYSAGLNDERGALLPSWVPRRLPRRRSDAARATVLNTFIGLDQTAYFHYARGSSVGE